MANKRFKDYMNVPNLFNKERTKQILYANPTIAPLREEAKEVVITIYDYNPENIKEYHFSKIQDCYQFHQNGHITWINIDGIRKNDVEAIAAHYTIHALLVEDIISMNQRPKMDEVEGVLFCLLNMLFFNKEKNTVETEQISIVMGSDFVISFQEDPNRDAFDHVRHRLNMANSKIRQRGADYLSYSLLDMIVDNYFVVMEQLGEQIELLEEEVVRNSKRNSSPRINQLRKELIVLKRNIAPVRDLVNDIIRSESDLLDDRTTKYFKDVYDHIIQAYDMCENYRDIMISMQDLYINNVNLRMNEVMKVMAIVTCLLAPATVIGGIFGMNFEAIPLLHNKWGFFISVGIMLLIPIWMLTVFRNRGWF